MVKNPWHIFRVPAERQAAALPRALEAAPDRDQSRAPQGCQADDTG